MPSKPETAETAAAPAPTAPRRRAPIYQKIDLARLLEPELATRQTFDEEALQGLIDSIRENGLIMPLVVSPEGAAFRVHAGHRRLVALRALKVSPVECKVYFSSGDALDAIQLAENADREAVNAAEEARYFGRLLELKCGGDVDALVTRLKKRRGYIEDRLILLRGDPDVLEALAGGVISIGVAAELNKVADRPRRMMYLDAAAQGGASVRMVRDWRTRGNAFDELQGEGPIPDRPLAGAVVRPEPVMTMQCYICGSGEDAHDMELLYVHRSCARVTRRLAEQGGSNGNS